jgi:hypothetical protein
MKDRQIVPNCPTTGRENAMSTSYRTYMDHDYVIKQTGTARYVVTVYLSVNAHSGETAQFDTENECRQWAWRVIGEAVRCACV